MGAEIISYSGQDNTNRQIALRNNHNCKQIVNSQKSVLTFPNLGIIMRV